MRHLRHCPRSRCDDAVAGRHAILLQVPPGSRAVLVRLPRSLGSLVLIVPVAKLTAVLNGLADERMTLEHIFDY